MENLEKEEMLAMQEMIQAVYKELGEVKVFKAFKDLIQDYEEKTGDLEFKRSLKQLPM